MDQNTTDIDHRLKKLAEEYKVPLDDLKLKNQVIDHKKSEKTYLDIIREIEAEKDSKSASIVNTENSYVSDNRLTKEQIMNLSVLIVAIIIIYYLRKHLFLIIKTVLYFFFNWIAYLYYLGDRKKQEEKSKLKDLKNM